MIGVLLADPAPEAVDFGAGAPELRAAQQLPIENLAKAAVAGDIVARDRLLAAVYPGEPRVAPLASLAVRHALGPEAAGSSGSAAGCATGLILR